MNANILTLDKMTWHVICIPPRQTEHDVDSTNENHFHLPRSTPLRGGKRWVWAARGEMPFPTLAQILKGLQGDYEDK